MFARNVEVLIVELLMHSMLYWMYDLLELRLKELYVYVEQCILGNAVIWFFKCDFFFICVLSVCDCDVKYKRLNLLFKMWLCKTIGLTARVCVCVCESVSH